MVGKPLLATISPVDKDNFGDRMKLYEEQECGRHFMPLAPIYARLDGRSFHSFTKGMSRPFDFDFIGVMQSVTKFLVGETGATVGYTQSDEISLAWVVDDFKSETFFNRRVFKMTSILAGLASSKFATIAARTWPERMAKACPCFDARVYTLPNEDELVNCFLWREQDATKNAITMAAQAYFSHKELHGKNGAQKQEMLFSKGVNFNDYPADCKRGAYFKRVLTSLPIDEATRLRIPEAKRPEKDQMVIRSAVKQLDLPQLGSIRNRADVLLRGMEPAPYTQGIPI